MTWKAWLKLTFVFLLLIAVWLLGRAIYYGSPPALTELRGDSTYWEGSIRLPVALPFWRDLLAAPLISLLIAATIHVIKSNKDEKEDGVGLALAFFWVFTTVLTAFTFGYTNAGLLISFLIGATTVGVAFSLIVLIVTAGFRTWEWINTA